MHTDFAIHQTVSELVESHARNAPEAAALLAPGRKPLTYGGLWRQMGSVVGELHRAGIGRNDRVAVVLKNGPELAAALVSVAAGAGCAPLNPEYRESEFDFYLADLKARALVVEDGIDSPAREVARNRGIPVLELLPESNAGAGSFTLTGVAPANCNPLEPARADDTALVLHTSGTTSRPKLVPLTQANICHSAGNVSGTLRLTPRDRCLNLMPLFHIHGLIGATLSSLAVGASVVCTPGFDVANFFDCLETMRPTWYTAVPTIHQSVLTGARARNGAIPHCLRLIRSSSASLPPQLLFDLEQIFNIPVIESYGMTEAAHQMCSNCLPPGGRKPGSVGLAAGPEVAVMGEAGQLLASNVVGEIAIRGANVTAGYDDNPAANQAAFTAGWLRTGDQGYCDQDGFFFLTGRLKELINRGGEKIAPREVDEILLAHPAVAQAVTFAVPHTRLGEDVAAAVVVRSGVSTTERSLREYALLHLAPHKVPSQVLFVDSIPKGPTGKLQRIGLFEKLESLLTPEFVPPADPFEEAVARIWSEVLEAGPIGVQDNFFYRGGDSLLATRVVARIRSAFEIEVPIAAMFHSPTVSEQARIIEDLLVREIESLPDDSRFPDGAPQASGP
jgi:acyl-CoA synthetase (AMP-forming)/AMP-acid ligase II